jgi:hypothetical protein
MEHDDQLVRALACAIGFMGATTEDIVRQDSLIAASEGVLDELIKMDDRSRLALCKQLTSLIASATDSSWRRAVEALIADLTALG